MMTLIPLPKHLWDLPLTSNMKPFTTNGCDAGRPGWATLPVSHITVGQKSWPNIETWVGGETATKKTEGFRLAIRATIYRSLWALRAQNRKKVSKRVFWGVCKKVPENTRKSQKIQQKVQFWVFFDFFGYFGDFFADPQKDSFWDFFAILGPEGPETPVNGRSDREFRHTKTRASFSRLENTRVRYHPAHQNWIKAAQNRTQLTNPDRHHPAEPQATRKSTPKP